MALNLPYGIKPVNALANVDERYGTYTSKALALIATNGTRKLGLTVGIIEDGKVVEYWFESGITDVDLVAKFPTTEIIDTNTAEVWDELKEYLAGNIYVSYVNISSPEIIFQTEALYRCRVSTTAGLSPEDSLYDEILNPTGSWIYQGNKITISSSSTATTVVQSLFDLQAIIGYKTDHTVSVIDTNLTYRFDSLTESGVKPNDGGSGSWISFCNFKAGHIIADKNGVYNDRTNLKFTGNVNVSNTIDSTIVNIGWNTVEIDSSVTTSFNAQPNIVYMVDGLAAPVIAILPDATIGDNSSYRFILKSDPHKLTITTFSGVQLIDGHTSQLIPTAKGELFLVCNGGGYNIITDTRNLVNGVEITENRDFTLDGFENNVIYYCKPNGGDLEILLPTAFSLPGDITISARFEQYGEGRVIISTQSGTIGDYQTQIISAPAQGFDIIWKGTEYLIQNDTRPKILTTSYTTYPVTEDSILVDSLTGTYFKQRVSTVEDSRFDLENETFDTFTITANPTDSYQLISSSITDAGILNGVIPEGSLSIFWNLYRTSSTNVNIYVKYWLRDIDNVETLIATSATGVVDNTTKLQYMLSTTHSEFTMTATDRIVTRYYARKATSGANPVLYMGYEGPNPSRSILEVSVGTISHNQMPGRDLDGAHPASAISLESGESVEVKIIKLYSESDVSPVDPNGGDKWLDTTSGILYEWFNDTDSTGAWVSWYKN